MKSKIKLPAVAIVLIAFFSFFSLSKTNAQVYGEVSFGVFYDELSPYGYWDNDPGYGDIWYPDVPNGFRPYSTNGYWAMTEYGNTWVSNYSWGWAPFHYGRWIHTPRRGWGWIPGYEWGPAWVEWRSGNGYYGWAPMMPRVGVHVSIGIPINLWIFAPTRHIYARDVYRHSHFGRANIYNRTTIINNTYVVNNRHYYGGPSRRDIERATGRTVHVRSIRQADRPGVSRADNRSVSIYRPDRDKNRNNSVRGNSKANTHSNNPNSNRTGVQRNTNKNATPRREMHIDKNGNTTMRNSSPSRQSSANGATTRNNNTNRATAPTTRQAEQHGQQSTPQRTQPNNSRSSGTTRVQQASNRPSSSSVSGQSRSTVQQRSSASNSRSTAASSSRSNSKSQQSSSRR
jgi:hypothetical protein